VFFQLWVGWIFGAGALVLAAIFLLVARSTRGEAVPWSQVAHRGYVIRRFWFGTLLLASVVALGTTLPGVPYSTQRLAAPAHQQPRSVHVTGQQWAWTMDPSTLPANRGIQFEVQSKDVNHDFGIYDSGGHIVAQVQAMPGFTNVLVTNFSPGTYTIRCLELCGQYHAAMIRTFEVH
jgi:cytochrome c oxidase subunit 2